MGIELGDGVSKASSSKIDQSTSDSRNYHIHNHNTVRIVLEKELRREFRIEMYPEAPSSRSLLLV